MTGNQDQLFSRIKPMDVIPGLIENAVQFGLQFVVLFDLIDYPVQCVDDRISCYEDMFFIDALGEQYGKQTVICSAK